MHMKNIFAVALLVATAAACNQPAETTKTHDATKTMETPAATTTAYTVDMVANKKDPACGMPVSAAINDTAHYDGKVLGFCSQECKDKFKEDPKALIAKAELKP